MHFMEKTKPSIRFHLLLSLLVLFYGSTYADDKIYPLVNIGMKHEPYQLLKSGEIVDGKMTGEDGVIYTTLHEESEEEYWVITLLNDSYGIKINKDGNSNVFRLPSLNTNYRIQKSFDTHYTKNHYLYLKIYGKEGSFKNEPYWIVENQKVTESGVSDSEGYFYSKKLLSNQRTQPFTILTCTGAAFSVNKAKADDKTFAMSAYFNVSYSQDKTLTLSPKMVTQCKESGLTKYANEKVQFNHGLPFLMIGVGEGLTPDEERIANEQQIEQEKKQADAEQSAYQRGETRFSPKNEIIPTGECPADLLGIFGIPENLPNKNVIEIAHDSFFSAATNPGDKALKLYQDGKNYYSQGMRSGTISSVSIKSGNAERPTVIDLFWKDTPVCTVDIGDGRYIYRVDYKNIPNEKLNQFRDYLSELWGITPTIEDLKNIHYFFAYTVSEVGVGGVSLVIPLQRMALQ